MTFCLLLIILGKSSFLCPLSSFVTPEGIAYTREIAWPFRIAMYPIRPLSPGSPISSVRIGLEDDLKHRQVEIQRERERWGIFGNILTQRS